MKHPNGGARRTGFSDAPEERPEEKDDEEDGDANPEQEAAEDPPVEAEAAAKTPPRRRPKRLADEEDEDTPGGAEAKKGAAGAKHSAESDSEGEDVDDILASSKKRIAEREALTAKDAEDASRRSSGNDDASGEDVDGPGSTAPGGGVAADHDFEDADWDADAKVRLYFRRPCSP